MNDSEELKHKVELAAEAFRTKQIRCNVVLRLIEVAESKTDMQKMLEYPNIASEIRERDRLEREFVVLRSRLRKKFGIATQWGRGMSLRFSLRAQNRTQTRHDF